MFVEYSFTLELYAKITRLDSEVKRSCIEVGIHKRVAEMWPRLLHDSSRPPPWIAREHSIMDSTDEESDSDAVEPLRLVTRM